LCPVCVAMPSTVVLVPTTVLIALLSCPVVWLLLLLLVVQWLATS